MVGEDLEPVFIEDLVRFGEDRGIEKGIEKGIAVGLAVAREALFELAHARGIVLTDAEILRIQNETSADVVREWIRRAAAAKSGAEMLG